MYGCNSFETVCLGVVYRTPRQMYSFQYTVAGREAASCLAAAPASHDRSCDSTTSVGQIDREWSSPGPQTRGSRRNDTGLEQRTEPGYPSLGSPSVVTKYPSRWVCGTGDPLSVSISRVGDGSEVGDAAIERLRRSRL